MLECILWHRYPAVFKSYKELQVWIKQIQQEGTALLPCNMENLLKKVLTVDSGILACWHCCKICPINSARWQKEVSGMWIFSNSLNFMMSQQNALQGEQSRLDWPMDIFTLMLKPFWKIN